MASGTFYCAAGTDDAWARINDSGFDLNGSAVVFGDYSNGEFDGLFRFINVTIPKDATINSATVTGTAGENRSETTINLIIKGELDAAPATFSNYANYAARTPTTATVAWNNVPAFTATSSYASPDIATIISEITSLAGWSSGNNLAIFYTDNSSDTDARRDYESYDDVGADIKLDVDWTPAVTTLSVTVSECE